jgi:hypothetical protein
MDVRITESNVEDGVDGTAAVESTCDGGFAFDLESLVDRALERFQSKCYGQSALCLLLADASIKPSDKVPPGQVRLLKRAYSLVRELAQ